MNVPNVTVKPAVMAPERIEVSSEGELVVITVGNSALRLHYADALTVSQWIRVRAKEAKARCGDVSRHWSAVALLSDAAKMEG
jgi:hypothetical protein